MERHNPGHSKAMSTVGADADLEGLDLISENGLTGGAASLACRPDGQSGQRFEQARESFE